MGGVLPYAQKGKLAGLSVFKSSLGGFLWPYYRGLYSARSRVLNLVP